MAMAQWAGAPGTKVDELVNVAPTIEMAGDRKHFLAGRTMTGWMIQGALNVPDSRLVQEVLSNSWKPPLVGQLCDRNRDRRKAELSMVSSGFLDYRDCAERV